MLPIVRVGTLACAWIFIATAAAAQTGPSSAETSWPPKWTVAGGIESLWWRDVAATGPPVDASPISWNGQGPVVYVAYDRGGLRRLHHFEGSYASAGGFELQSPVRSIAAPGGDSAFRLIGRYEYRRYPFRDLWITGFDVGIGVEGSGESLSFVRHFDPGIELQTGVTNMGVAGIVAARLRRWSRWSATAAWGNRAVLGRSSQHHTGETDSTTHSWGAGWETTLDLRVDVRVSSRAFVHAAYLTSGEGRLASHDTFTNGRSRFTIGVGYGR